MYGCVLLGCVYVYACGLMWTVGLFLCVEVCGLVDVIGVG